MSIYVGNLSLQVTEGILTKAFEKFGKVNSVYIGKDNFSGNKLGFGFVEMPGSKQAKEAVKALNHTKIKERTIIVCETKVRQERKRAKQ